MDLFEEKVEGKSLLSFGFELISNIHLHVDVVSGGQMFCPHDDNG